MLIDGVFCQGVIPSGLALLPWVVGCQFPGTQDLPPVRLMPLARDSGWEIMTGSLHPFNPTG